MIIIAENKGSSKLGRRNRQIVFNDFWTQKELNPKYTQKEHAEKYGVKQSTICELLKDPKLQPRKKQKSIEEIQVILASIAYGRNDINGAASLYKVDKVTIRNWMKKYPQFLDVVCDKVPTEEVGNKSKLDIAVEDLERYYKDLVIEVSEMKDCAFLMDKALYRGEPGGVIFADSQKNALTRLKGALQEGDLQTARENIQTVKETVQVCREKRILIDLQ